MQNNPLNIKTVNDTCFIKSSVSVESDTPIYLVYYAMKVSNVEVAAIIDGKDRLIGFVMIKDIVDQMNKKYVDEETTYAVDVMHPWYLAATPEDSVMETLRNMDKYMLSWLPVTDSHTNEFMGLVCRSDLERNITYPIVVFHDVSASGFVNLN